MDVSLSKIEENSRSEKALRLLSRVWFDMLPGGALVEHVPKELSQFDFGDLLLPSGVDFARLQLGGLMIHRPNPQLGQTGAVQLAREIAHEIQGFSRLAVQAACWILRFDPDKVEDDTARKFWPSSARIREEVQAQQKLVNMVVRARQPNDAEKRIQHHEPERDGGGSMKNVGEWMKLSRMRHLTPAELTAWGRGEPAPKQEAVQ